MTNKKISSFDELEDSTKEDLDHEKWFEDNIHHYKSLAAMVSATLKSTLDGHGISYVDIPFREKSKKSFLKKIEDKNKEKTYSPKDMTDLAGIRVITLIESDIKKVSELIQILFKVHPEDSINKTESLGEDKVGYRSVHFVCDIGETRAELPEWEFLKGHSFEIQVRTALMHAWAEIEHDRGYKLSGKLPSDLARRFSLLSGLLESADLEFNRLTVEIENYAKNIKIDFQQNRNESFELSTISVTTLINLLFSDFTLFNDNDFFLEEAIDAAIEFGINNTNDLKKILLELKPNLDIDIGKQHKEIGDADILLIALMYNNLEVFLDIFSNNKKYNFNLSRIPYSIVKTFKSKYPAEKLTEIFDKYEIEIIG